LPTASGLMMDRVRSIAMKNSLYFQTLERLFSRDA